MRTILHAAHIGQAAPIRVVMLPAAYSRPEDFVREGFVEAVRARALAVDLVFAAPELPQVVDRSALECLHEDIVRPARRAGRAGRVGGSPLGGYHAPSAAGPPTTGPGGHDWPTWRTLWERFLDARLTPHPTPAR